MQISKNQERQKREIEESFQVLERQQSVREQQLQQRADFISASQPSSIASSRRVSNDKDSQIDQIIEDIRRTDMQTGCLKHGVRLTKKGLPDKRTTLGKAIFARIDELERRRDASNDGNLSRSMLNGSYGGASAVIDHKAQ